MTPEEAYEVAELTYLYGGIEGLTAACACAPSDPELVAALVARHAFEALEKGVIYRFTVKNGLGVENPLYGGAPTWSPVRR